MINILPQRSLTKDLMGHVIRALIITATVLTSFSSLSQDYFTYRVLIDEDRNDANGCSFELGDIGNPNQVGGFEHLLEITMVAPGEFDQYQVTGVNINCDDGVWDTLSSVPLSNNSWSATLNQDGQPDIIEAFIPKSILNFPDQLRLVVQAESSASDEVDSIVENDGSPIIFTMLGQNVPFLPNIALWSLFATMLFIVSRKQSLRIPITSLFILAGVSSLFVIYDVDSELNDHCSSWGWCADWSSETPIATDPSGDVNDPAIDLQSLYVLEATNENIAVRIDVNDVTNACASLSPCDANASCTNEPQGYSCACNEGYQGNGSFCADSSSLIMLPFAMTSSVGTSLIPVTCNNGDCSCPAGFTGPGVVLVYSYAYSGVCTEAPVPANTTCNDGICSCDNGFYSTNILGAPVWDMVSQSYNGECLAPQTALFGQAIYDSPLYQFAPEASSGEFGVTTWQ